MLLEDGSLWSALDKGVDNLTATFANTSRIKNGAKNGIYKLYYDNAQIQIDGFTRDGYVDGLCTHYNREGKKIKEGEYREGKPIGIWKEYNSAGVKQ